MQYEHDASAPEVHDDRTVPRELDYLGPLRPAEQAWADCALRLDTHAARHEPVDVVIRRREAHIDELYRTAALLTLSGDLGGASAAGFRAVAESRALTEFLTASPAYCLDCFLLGERCTRHDDGAAGSGSTRSASPGSGTGSGSVRPHQPEWRRFGADEFPSAGG